MNSTSSSIASAEHRLTITVNDLSKRFNREWIFQAVDYTFTTGHTYAITGPNGSGKSTLLQVIWGQVPPSSGTIRYQKGTAEIPVDEAFRYLAIATPYMDLIDEFSLVEMLNFHFKLKKLRAGLRIDDLLGSMYLEASRDKQLVNFSSGMKQRLKLALAFYTVADVYFLDEPGTNLDTRAFDWYLRELREVEGKAMVFIASNNPAEYPAAATQLNILDYKRRKPI